LHERKTATRAKAALRLTEAALVLCAAPTHALTTKRRHSTHQRTFSPSDVAYWDLAKGSGGGGGEGGGEGVSATRSGSGFFGKLSALFGGGK
jgi:hypothetical protein